MSTLYFSPGMSRVYTMSTYFFLNLIMRGYEGSIQRWNKDVDIFSYHLLLVPIHLEQHWCLAIVDFRNKVGRRREDNSVAVSVAGG